MSESRKAQFITQWGGDTSIDAFPQHWHAFVSHFRQRMHDGKQALVQDLEYDFGYKPRPLPEFNDSPNMSSIAFEDFLKTISENNEKRAIEARSEFKEEDFFWTSKNLCKLFVTYLAGSPTELNKIKLEDYMGKAAIRDCVIDRMLEHIIPKLDDLPELFDSYFSALADITRGYKEKEGQEIYEIVKVIYDDCAILRASSGKELNREWQRLHATNLNEDECLVRTQMPVQVLPTPAPTPKLERNVQTLEPLTQVAEPLTQISEPRAQASAQVSQSASQPTTTNAPFIAASAGIGGVIGAAIVLGLVFTGVLAVFATPVVILIAAAIFIGAATIGGGVAKFAVSQSGTTQDVAAENTPATTTSASAKTFSTGLCAVFLGITSCSGFAADGIDPVDPIKKESTQDVIDVDDAETEAPFKSSSTKPGSHI